MKIKEIREMDEKTRTKKLKELKLELAKSKVNANKSGNSKAREIRKIIAKIMTINNSKTEELKHK